MLTPIMLAGPLYNATNHLMNKKSLTKADTTIANTVRIKLNITSDTPKELMYPPIELGGLGIQT